MRLAAAVGWLPMQKRWSHAFGRREGWPSRTFGEIDRVAQELADVDVRHTELVTGVELLCARREELMRQPEITGESAAVVERLMPKGAST
jgi:hypothetical protein